MFGRGDIQSTFRLWMWIYQKTATNNMSSFIKSLIWVLRIFTPVYLVLILAGMISTHWIS
jgi:hypothetical protein